MPSRVVPVPSRIPTRGLGAWLARRSDGHRLHAGVDLRMGAAGPTSVCVAPEAGTVRIVGTASRPSEPRMSMPPGWAGYGPQFVVMEGDSGRFHMLGHLNRVQVRAGDRVSAGDVISTHGSAVAHCHWEVRTMQQPRGDATVTITLDPGAWLRGEDVPWHEGQCPESPVNDQRTPRACRPGVARRVPRAVDPT